MVVGSLLSSEPLLAALDAALKVALLVVALEMLHQSVVVFTRATAFTACHLSPVTPFSVTEQIFPGERANYSII